MQTLKVTFRDIKATDIVGMFYYDERKNLVEFTFQNGHSNCSYGYYLRDTLPHGLHDSDLVDLQMRFFSAYYDDADTKIRYCKRISRGDNAIKSVSN